MKKQILTFGASSSRESINRKLALYSADQIMDSLTDSVDLNDYEMPIYSIDKENAAGIPELAQQFKKKILDADGIIVSFAEHNGAYSAAFKNVYDWVSRIDQNVWAGKPMLLMATSPGVRGGQGVLQLAANSFGHSNDKIVQFSLPSFYTNFSEEYGIKDEGLKSKHLSAMASFKSML